MKDGFGGHMPDEKIITDPTPTQTAPAPLPITPQLRQPDLSRQQRDLSTMPTQMIFDTLKATSKTWMTAQAYDHELWDHLEGRLKYLLNMVGMR